MPKRLKQNLIVGLCLAVLLSPIAYCKSKLSTKTVENENYVPSYLEDYDPNYPYVCNHVTNLYHVVTCPDLAAQESKMFKFYKSEESAKQDGCTSCETCLGIGE